MTVYLTVIDMSVRFPNPRTGKPRDEKTIRRWIDEGKPIIFDGNQYLPEKDPGGRCWRFKVIPAPVED